jgi:DNA-binding CsgD family transcriptional regulator
MAGAAGDVGRPLLGRDAETTLLKELLDRIESSGGALVIRGEPGIGKSRLLAEAAALARERAMTVLSATGVQSEARLAFSGLHQMLRPVRARAAALPSAHRSALDAAFGLGDGPPPEHFRIAMAVLDLLSEVAADAPLVLVAEDAHWLDGATSDVLAFVARRLESDPIVLLAASRDGYRTALDAAGLAELRLAALEPDAAAELLTVSARKLSVSMRRRLLLEAAGNPLALIELPEAAARLERDAPMPDTLPLTERLEHAFAARVSDLPEETRLLLLVAALNDGEIVSEVLLAGSAVAGSSLELELLEPAAQASIIDLDVRTLRFRHPLIRSAIRQYASVPQRLRVHEALAETLRGDPDRRVWHRAALIAGAHEDIALELEQAGRRARRRGATAVAAAALRRAAELSEPAQRGRRLLAAADIAFELGQRDVVVRLLREVEQLAPGPLERARATWIDEKVETRPLGDAARATALIAAADRAGEEGDRDLQLDLLWLVASRTFLVEPGPAARQILIDAVRRLGPLDTADPRVLAIQAYADPFGSAPDVLARLREASANRNRDTEAALYLGPAAIVVGAFDLAMTFLGAAVEGLRAEGRLGHLPRMLVLHGGVAARIGDWSIAMPAAEEARRLATELGEPQWAARADTILATIAGMRGDEEEAERAAAEAERVGVRMGANIVIALAQFGRMLAALGAGRHDDAYAAAECLFDPNGPGYHPVMACWLIGDLAEAALHIDRAEEARARLAQVEATVGESPGIWILLALRHARALLAEGDDEAAERFQEALGADLGPWPFQRARILLAYGQWLRRRRRIADSREPLRTARDTFDALGCAAWSEQARRELRASGESSRRRDPSARDELTAQELQIAHLAANGLSNREIGQMLYVSHRTVGTHLYRIFPKLGVTARGDLGSALTATAAAAGP